MRTLIIYTVVCVLSLGIPIPVIAQSATIIDLGLRTPHDISSAGIVVGDVFTDGVTKGWVFDGTSFVTLPFCENAYCIDGCRVGGRTSLFTYGAPCFTLIPINVSPGVWTLAPGCQPNPGCASCYPVEVPTSPSNCQWTGSPAGGGRVLGFVGSKRFGTMGSGFSWVDGDNPPLQSLPAPPGYTGFGVGGVSPSTPMRSAESSTSWPSGCS